MDAVLDACVAQEGCDELARAVRLVAAGEAARQDDHLRAADGALELLCALAERVSGEVADYDDLSSAACVFDCTCGIVLAVGAREYRDDSERLCTLDRRSGRIALGEGDLGQVLVGSGGHGREYALESALKGSGQLVDGDLLARDGDGLVCGGLADIPLCRQLAGSLDEDAAEVLHVERVGREALVDRKADPVAEGHLRDALRDAAGGQRPCGNSLAGGDEVCDLVPDVLHGDVVRRAVLIVRRVEEVDRMAGFLELGRDQTGSVLRRDGEGNERGRYVHVIERAGHGVLAADGREAQVLSCAVYAPSRADSGLPQRFGSLPRLLEVLLEGQVCGLEIAACCDELGHRRRSTASEAPMIRILLGAVRVEAAGHDATRSRY